MPHLSTDNRGGYGSLSKLAGPTSRKKSARRRIGRDRDSRPWPQFWSRPQERQHSDLMSHTREALTNTMNPARRMDCPPLMPSPRAASLSERRRARRERRTCQLTRPCRPRGPPDRAKLCRPFEAQLDARAGAAAARFANALRGDESGGCGSEEGGFAVETSYRGQRAAKECRSGAQHGERLHNPALRVAQRCKSIAPSAWRIMSRTTVVDLCRACTDTMCPVQTCGSFATASVQSAGTHYISDEKGRKQYPEQNTVQA